MKDLIERQAAIEAVYQALRKPSNSELFMWISNAIKELPPAQPDIIRCKDCKWYGRVDKRRFYSGMDCLQKRIDMIIPDEDFCSKAERKEDE